MAKVIPRIHKYELPGDLTFALKYVDFEACFSSRNKQDVYLDVVLQNKQLSGKKIRERSEAQGVYQLVKIRYDPSNQRLTAWEWANGPWKDAKNPIIIEAWIYGFPKKLRVSVGLTRLTLQKILLKELQRLLPKGARWSMPRNLTLNLLAKELAIECTSTIWSEKNGHSDEQTRIVSLDDKEVGQYRANHHRNQ